MREHIREMLQTGVDLPRVYSDFASHNSPVPGFNVLLVNIAFE